MPFLHTKRILLQISIFARIKSLHDHRTNCTYYMNKYYKYCKCKNGGNEYYGTHQNLVMN
jgi:hypothetical protein